MAEDKKDQELTLEDLGLEEQETPAEKAEKENKKTTKKKVVEESKVIKDEKSGVEIHEMKVDPELVKKIETEPKEHKKIDVATNREEKIEKDLQQNVTAAKDASANNADGTAKYGRKISINEFAKKPISKKENPIRQTLDNLYDLADKGIERTKKELTAPGGRIDEAKFKYIEYRYNLLMKRAEKSPKLKKHIEYVDNLIDTYPEFDGITEHERKGYILFKVAHDEKVGISDKDFGFKEKPMKEHSARLSSDASEDVDKMSEGFDDDDDIAEFNSDSVSLGKDDSPSEELPEKDIDDLLTDEEKEEVEKAKKNPPKQTYYVAKSKEPEIPEVEEVSPTTEDDGLVTVDTSDDDATDSADDTDSTEDSDEDDNLVSDEEMKVIRKRYVNQLITDLNLDKSSALSDFTISSKPVKMNLALAARTNRQSQIHTSWPLYYSGKNISLTPLSGEEIISITNNNNLDLRDFFATIYKHLYDRNKPSYETWLKSISENETVNIIFAIYVDNFKDINYLPYECKNKECKNVFLRKRDIKDMLIFADDKVKNRFYKIYNGEEQKTLMFKTKPTLINDHYAFSFCTPSIYSALFEPSSLKEDFTKKYTTEVYISQYINKVYYVDEKSKTLSPIDFGVIAKDLEKTTMRKIRGLNTIIKNFTIDERAILMDKVNEIVEASIDKSPIKYQIPEDECPVCHKKVESFESRSIDLLFTRANLPNGMASIRE